MRISSAEFIRKFSLLCDEALTQPLIISRHGRDRLVIMSLGKYRELTNPPEKQAQPEPAAPLASANGRKQPGNGRSRPRTR
jgi:PHD/YefM family antitoxin component YafN of YafNO toxin-antitoxin module